MSDRLPTWDEQMGVRPPTPAPRREFIATLFRVLGGTGRPLRCAAYRITTGIDLRIEYEDREDDFVRTQLFRTEDEDAIATLAAQWHQTLLAAGFTDLPDGAA